MREGIYSGKSYPVYNCTEDVLRVLEKSRDPKVRAVAKLIVAKRERPPFHVWIFTQLKRKDGVGGFARWLKACGVPFGVHRLGLPPASLVLMLRRARRLGRLDISDRQLKNAAAAFEEWDRWGA